MTFRTVLLATLALGLTAARAVAAIPSTPFWQYPAIKGYGAEHSWPGVVARPQAHATYKAVFDLTRGDARATTVNTGLNLIARTVNVFASAALPLGHLKFALIIHGPATALALSAAAFQRKFGHPNPNLALLAALRKAGVELMVCGDALAVQHATPAEVNPDVHVALAALSTLIMLQNRGYALVRL